MRSKLAVVLGWEPPWPSFQEPYVKQMLCGYNVNPQNSISVLITYVKARCWPRYPGPSGVDKISLNLCPMRDASPNNLCVAPTPSLYRILDNFNTTSSDLQLLILFRFFKNKLCVHAHTSKGMCLWVHVPIEARGEYQIPGPGSIDRWTTQNHC